MFVLPPSSEDLDAFQRAVTPNDPGIGILDTRSGRIYLALASTLPDGDHASLAERSLGIVDVEAGAHLRGFVLGTDGSEWRFVNNSGLNPNGNRMESELFVEVVATVRAALDRPTE